MQQLCKPEKQIGGFKQKSAKLIPEQNAVLYEFRHTPSDARLLYLATEDKNKFFSVTFQTIPENSTGVFHILEHSVFCGSEKYPVKEPFLEMEKGSVNTYLNAMTFSDHTMFPVSSRNEKDFLNLTSVYLDAVFRPLIYQNPNIFYQEGWHYSFEEKEVGINGVVYNEMKGVEASVDSRIHEEMLRQLFPDTCYRFTSGGDTREIPKLTYEEFLDTHRRFYRPKNAVFYLEGSMDLEKPIKMIEEYLYKEDDIPEFQKQNRVVSKLEPENDFGRNTELCASFSEIPEIEIQKPVPPTITEITYPITEEEAIEDRTYLVLGKIICQERNRTEDYAASILADYLTSSMESPLTGAILNRQLGQDVSMTVDTDFLQTCLYIQVDNSDEKHLEEIKELLQKLTEEVPKASDFHEKLDAIITNYEFGSKEKEEPRALYHAMDVMQTYLYGSPAEENLVFEELYAELRGLLKTDYYEKLLAKLLDVKSFSVVIAKPSYTKAEEERKEEQSYLHSQIESWSSEKKAEIIQRNEDLLHWQQVADEPEQKKKLPTLTLADLDVLPQKNITIEKEYQNTKILIYPAEISDMAYLKAYFPVPDKYRYDLEKLSLLGDLLLDMPTRRYDLMSLEHQINATAGNVHFTFITAENIHHPGMCQVYFAAEISFLKNKSSEAVELLLEIVQNTIYEDKELVKNILSQLQEAFRNEINENGSDLGMRRVQSGWSSRAAARERLEGISCYEKLKAFCENFDAECEELLAFLQEAIKELITREKLVISLTIPKQDAENGITEYAIDKFIDQLPKGTEKKINLSFDLEKKKSFVQLPSGVGYSAAGIRISDCLPEQVAAWRAACHMLSIEYLWNTIRVQGGAYGTECNFNYYGDLTFYSYRDPDCCKSLEILKKAADYLEAFAESGESLDRYIIGAAAKLDGLMSPQVIGEMLGKEYLSGITYDDLAAVYTAMLTLDIPDILKVAEALRNHTEKMSQCLLCQDSGDFIYTEKILL